MTRMRSGLGLLSALLLVAFALPASAQNTKTFTITPPLSLPVATQTIQVTFTITGNSNPNSIELDATSMSSLVINPTPAPTLSAGFTGTLSVNSNNVVQFTNISPSVKKTIIVTLNVTTIDASCAQSTATWFAHAWTGSPSNPSQTFTLTNSPTTSINPACTLSFITQPANAFKDSIITSKPFNSNGTPVVQVQLLQNGSAPPATSVSLSSACTISGGTATTDGSGLASFTALKGTVSASGCVLTASASGYNSANSNSFDIVEPAGTLGCNNSNNFAHGGGSDVYDPNTSGPFFGDPGWGLRRGPNTTDPTGGDCTQIPYTFTFDGTTAGFVADKLGQSIIVEYVLVTPTTTLVTGDKGWPPLRHSKFAWGPGLHNPPLDGEFIDALACSNEDITGASGSPLPTIPSVAPYSTSGFPQYNPPGPALMCAAQQGWTSVGTGMVQFWLKVIDTDGWTEP